MSLISATALSPLLLPQLAGMKRALPVELNRVLMWIVMYAQLSLMNAI